MIKCCLLFATNGGIGEWKGVTRSGHGTHRLCYGKGKKEAEKTI